MKKKTDVLLVYPPSIFEDELTAEGKLHRYQIGNKKLGTWPPLGLMYLAASLEKNGISCEIINPFVEGLNLRETITTVKKFSPRIVGIAVTTLQVRGAVQLAQAIKKKFGKEVVVVVGGPHVSIDPDFVKKFDCFDSGLVGEGEITFPRVVKNVLRGKKVKKVVIGELPPNLDDIPFPARDKIKIPDYFETESPSATMMTLRGCPFKCLFCSKVAISNRVRYHDPKLVVDEMERIKDDYDGNFVFLDDTFTLIRDHTMALCQEIIDRGLKVKWSCNTRASLLDEELVKKMKEAGCGLILIGVESGDEDLRNKVLNKRITDKDIKKAVKLCKKAGIMIGGYFMLGFPGETKEQLWKTANAPKKFDLDIMSIHATTIYPGSDLFAFAEKEKKEDYLKLWYLYADGQKKLEELPLVYIPKGIDFSEIEKARRWAYFKFYFRPSFIIKQVIRDLRSFKDFKRDVLQAMMLLRFGKTSKDLK